MSAYTAAGWLLTSTWWVERRWLWHMTGAAEHMLAMKAIAGRRYADREDLSLLVDMLGLSTVDEVERITMRVFPDEPLTDRSRLLLSDVLEARRPGAL